VSRLTVRPVTPEHWLRGIAAALLEGALTHARKRRASSLEAYPHLSKKDDYMGQLDFVRGGEELVAPDIGEEELQAVRGPARGGGGLGSSELRLLLLFPLGLGGSGSGRRRDLEPDPLELGRQLLDLLVVQVELHRESLELGSLEVAALLRALDHRLGLIRLEQLVKLVLGQGLLSPFGPAVRRQRAFSL